MASGERASCADQRDHGRGDAARSGPACRCRRSARRCARTPPGAERLDRKTAWYVELRSRFGDRLDGIDADIAERWADVSVRFPSLRDGDKVILATALVRGYAIATRNVGDFRASGIELVDPFDPATWMTDSG